MSRSKYRYRRKPKQKQDYQVIRKPASASHAPLPPAPQTPPQLLMQQNNLNLHAFPRAFPASEELERLREFIPDVGERFITGWDEQRRHRMRIEFVFALFPYATLLGALAAVTLVAILSYNLIMAGHDLAGSAFGGLDLVGLAGVFLYASTRKTESKKK